MIQKDTIICENLSGEEGRTLIVLLNLMIPPSEDGAKPGASDVGFFDYMRNENLLHWIREGLQNVIEESHHKHGKEFSILVTSDQLELINCLRRKHLRFFTDLTNTVMQCYYLHDDVLKAIGLEARPPFPDGYVLEDGDFTLLEPVYERGKIYRE